MIQRFLLVTIAFLFGFRALSQTLNDPIYFNYSLLPKTDFDKQIGMVANSLVEVNVTAPAIKIGKATKLFNAAYYRNSNFEYGNTFPQSNSFPATLHDIRYSAIMRIQLNSKWELVTIPRIMIRSDLSQSIHRNDFFTQVALLYLEALRELEQKGTLKPLVR